MHIEKLEIRGFGKLNDLTLELVEGMNFIFGANEAGKTSIQNFIRSMFYGLKGGRTAKDGTLPPLKKYKPWVGGEYSGFIQYCLDNREVYRVGRNFENNSVRVFDAIFNDITGSFPVSREKGVLFAERHLGINEVCFDRTVFVRQMETRVDSDESKELVNRLTNAAQTGFDNVSFNMAREALKEALKIHVGNEKTSKRPLDKVAARLEELQRAKEALMGKRNSLFSAENELKQILRQKNALEGTKSYLDKLKERAGWKKGIENLEKAKKDLLSLSGEIDIREEELNKVLSSMEELEALKKQVLNFSMFDDGDIDEISREYHQLVNLTEYSRKLSDDLQKRKESFEEMERRITPLRGFGTLEDRIENKITNIKNDLDVLKEELGKNNIEQFNQKIQYIQSKERRFKILAAIFSFTTLALIAAGLAWRPPVFAAAAGTLAATAVYLWRLRKASGELGELKSEKRMSFIRTNNILEEVKGKEKMLREVFEKAGAKSMEDFLKSKEVYDFTVQQLLDTGRELHLLESEHLSYSQRIAAANNLIRERLYAAGVAGVTEAGAITEGHLDSFKQGVREYARIEPQARYTEQRAEDLRGVIQTLYRKASDIYQGDISSRYKFSEAIAEIGQRVDELERKLTGFTGSLPEIDAGRLGPMEDFPGLNEESPEGEIDRAYGSVSAELNEVHLKIREYETMIKSLSNDNEELQRVEEEIGELEARKGQLEGIYDSLKTALDVLTEASMEIQRDFVPVLNAKMSEVVHRMTGGRYEDIRADDDLIIKAIAPETQDVVAASLLSGGTVDQVYLALRLGMADLMTEGGETLPLILDEVFAQYDDGRTRAAMEYFKHLSAQRQVILFSCKRREVDLVREVCGGEFNLIEI